MFIEKGTVWAGLESSLHHLTEISAKFSDKLPEMMGHFQAAPTGEATPYTVTPNGTALIGIKGALVNRDLPDVLAQMFGLTTYPSLQRQFIQAANDPAVKRVLLDVNSGGGQVSGLYETVDELNNLKDIKPVATFSSDLMASAAYWLGSAGQKIGISKTCDVGSIGVIAVHFQEKEAWEREGMKPTVVRAGARKHLGHALEDFTSEAHAEMQSRLNQTHQYFMQAVAQHRGASLANLHQVSDGSIFSGSHAVQVGLADSTSTFKQFLADFETETSVAGSSYQRGGFAAEHGVSTMNLEQAMARISELEAADKASKTALEAAETRAANADAQLASLNASNQALSASLASANEDRKAYAQMLDQNIRTMGVALNAELLIPDDLAGKQAYFNQLQEKFNAKFPAGGVAASAQAAQEPQTAVPEWLNKVVKG